MCDCEREGPDFRERDYLELLDSSEYMGRQGASCRYEHRRCTRCGTVWFLSIGGDNPDTGTDILSRQRIDPDQTPLHIETHATSEKMNLPAEPYLGRWKDESGRVLAIRFGGDGAILADYTGKDGIPYTRSMLNFRKSPSRDMPAAMNGQGLVVELGTPGLGPTLFLVRADDAGRRALVPRLDMGLYDDWEDDLGAPWVLPLSEFSPAP